MYIQERESHFPDSLENARSKQPKIPRIVQETVEDKAILILDLSYVVLTRNKVVSTTHDSTNNNFSPFKTAGYRVVFGLSPGSPDEELWTPLVQGYPNPRWNATFKMELTSPWDLDSLTVELMRYGSECSDPETSTGNTLVGRALIPLPVDLNKKRRCIYPLEKLEGESGYNIRGRIHLALQLCPMI